MPSEKTIPKIHINQSQKSQSEDEHKPSLCDEGGDINPKLLETTEKSEVTDSMIEQQPNKVPDGGYGWLIVLGCFVSHLLMGGLERSDGIFFLEFQEKFGQSAQLTSWPGALVSALRLSLGPVASAVCNRYSVRSACMIGSAFVFTGLFLNGFAPNFYFLFFSHFIVQGIGRGLIYAPGLFIVGMYFDKRRGIATGLATSGVGVGTFFMVPVAQLLVDLYGYQGGFMLIAATSLHFSLSAMLYRPLSLHYKFTKGKEEKAVDEISLQEGLVVANAVESFDAHSIRSWKAYHNSRRNLDSINYEDDSFDEQRFEKEHIPSKPRKEGCLKSSMKICFPVDKANTNKTTDEKTRKVFHFDLLKNPSFLMYCLSIMLFTASFKAAFTFIPAQVKSLGFSDSEAAMVLSATGILDTAGRIFFGFLFDLKPIKPWRPILYTGFIFLVAAVSFIIPTISGYVAIALTCSCYGMLTGGYVSQKSIITVDILGVSHIANSFGLLALFQGIGMIIGPPISGAFKDATGSFDLAFYVGGGLMIFAAFLMILSNIFLRKQQNAFKENTVM